MLIKFKHRPSCEGTDTEQWFSQNSGEYKNQELLTRICAGCPARQQCLEYALEYSVIGFWAGTTDRRRKELRRKMGIIPKPILPEWELNRRGA